MRLIDADVAKEWFKGGRLHMFSDDVLNRIDHCPTIDAVPVVRCKNCQFCYENPCNELLRCRSQKGLNRIVDEMEYCSYGDRKEGDGDV